MRPFDRTCLIRKVRCSRLRPGIISALKVTSISGLAHTFDLSVETLFFFRENNGIKFLRARSSSCVLICVRPDALVPPAFPRPTCVTAALWAFGSIRIWTSFDFSFVQRPLREIIAKCDRLVLALCLLTAFRKIRV